MSRTKSARGNSESPPPESEIIVKPFAEALSERYLAYALSTIMARSLPDVRDGLKPVHRRLMYAMRELRLAANTAPKKSARVVGDVIGKFHPHGDTAVYDALVRLAQDFNVRYPLVDGQGNFGNIDGDNAAAMRYTEARLTAVAEALMEGLDEDAVDFRATYDGGGLEPAVMPAAFPNLLANGASGIAVGMATSIPPHNADEICAALRYLIKTPRAGFDKLLDLLPGPDFPTGGKLVENRETMLEAYKTGRGSFRVRAKWETEKLGAGIWNIIVTEMPWQVQKSRLIEKVAELLQAKKLPLLDDIRDESADDVRLVLVPKSRNVDPVVLMEQLFRATDLETRISLNMNVLDGTGVPRVLNIREVLQAFLDHRLQVLERRTKNRLAQIADRLEVLGGLLVCYLNIDAVIKIIRNEDEPKVVLMKKYKLTERQAEAILNMRLRALRKLEEIEIRKENDALTKEQKELTALLKSDDKKWAAIDNEIADIQTKFGKKTPLGKRRTVLADAPADVQVPIESVIERENVTVFLSEKGWVRTMKGHVEDNGSGYKEGDGARFAIQCETVDKLLLFATNGKFYTIGVDKLPRGRGYGEPVRMMTDMGADDDIVQLIVYKEGQKFIVASTSGHGFVVAAADVLAQTKNGKQALNVSDDAKAVACALVEGDHVAVLGTNHKMVVFPLSEVPEMARGKGVTLQKYKGGELSDVKTFNKKEGLTWQSGGKTRTEPDVRMWLMARAAQGCLAHGLPKSNKFND
ncbi:MAG: DNA topoisomerase IV subunit A [Bdellovibrionales bacterium]